MVLGLIALTALSAVPTAIWVSAATPVQGVAATAASAAPSHPSPVRSNPSTATPGAVDRAALCVLGVAPGCLPGASPAAHASVPAGADPISSWANITPPPGQSNPPPRFLPSMSYDPAAHAVILFGGYGEIGVAPFAFYQDTWSFVNNRWTELISGASCTPSTCPSPRAGAMLAYYAPDNALLLFGGYIYNASVDYVPYNDTWLFENGAWTNITASAGPAPSPRFEGSMVWDAYDNDVLLFGGSLPSGTSLGDTWTFDGSWHNLTATLSYAPSARAGAAIADSPSGWILLYGGATNGIVILDPSCSDVSTVAWWFFDGQWVPIDELACPMTPHGPDGVLPNGNPPPCGRLFPSLGWSPKNQRFVLYGGWGPTFWNATSCGGFYGFMNDTWTFANPPGDGWAWDNATDAGDPSAREEMGYASDFTDNYFEIFGGWNGTNGGLNETWRFYEVVHAKLTGPSDIDTSGALSFLLPFTVTGFGGTGDLSYSFAIHGIRNSNKLSGTNCQNLTDGVSTNLPYDGVDEVKCQPLPTSYNVYRLTVTVVDNQNVTDRATANWTFTVSPPETLAIYSQYKGYFYSGITWPDKFGILASVAGLNASTLSASLAGVPVPFGERSPESLWWDGSVDMGTVPYGDWQLQVVANFPGNWTLNASLPVDVIETPSWLLSVIQFPEVTQTNASHGTGPYNLTYSVTEAFKWSLSQALGFNIDLPFVKGNVSLIPAITVSLTATSTGNLSLSGGLSLTPPSIDLGVVSLGISVSFNMTGTFTIGNIGGSITGITWQSAVASITISGKLSASVPIYGFDILGVKVGFTLQVELDPSITLGLLLAPTTPGFDEFINGIQVKIQQFIGSFTFPLSVSVSFGIGIASVAIGGSVSIAVSFATNTGLYISGGWINGSIFVSASFLWWSDQWNLVSGTIYSWTSPPPTLSAAGAPSGGLEPAYDNGTNTTWVFHARYYTGAGYDRNVWIVANSTGTAISDIYPYTSVTAAAAATGAYLFYTDDNVSLPVQEGLTVSGAALGATSNALAKVPSPTDPGFLVYGPKATTLPDGNVYVLWDAVPTSEESLKGPANLTVVALHGAPFYPGNRTWGPVRAWTDGGIAQSYLADPTSGALTVAALVSPGYLIGTTTAERLLEFNLTTGSLLSNVSVTGLAGLVSVRGALGTAVVREVGGNFTTVALGSGALSPIAYTSPIGGNLVSAELAAGSRSTAVLLYRATNRSLLALYDLDSGAVAGTLQLPGNVADAQGLAGGATMYVFVRSPSGFEGWSETGGAFSNLTNVSEPGIAAYGLVQFGSGILVYSLAATGNRSQPTVLLDLAEVGATLEPVGAPAPSSSTPSSSTPASTYLLDLGIAAGAVAVLLAVVAVLTRRPPKGGGAPPTAWEAPPAAGAPPSGSPPPTSPPEGNAPP